MQIGCIFGSELSANICICSSDSKYSCSSDSKYSCKYRRSKWQGPEQVQIVKSKYTCKKKQRICNYLFTHRADTPNRSIKPPRHPYHTRATSWHFGDITNRKSVQNNPNDILDLDIGGRDVRPQVTESRLPDTWILSIRISSDSTDHAWFGR